MISGMRGHAKTATPAPTTVAAAAEIRRRCPLIGKARLHCLLYYVQGYHLTWEGTAAFDDPIEACKSGPVVSSLWHAEKLGRRVESADVPAESVRNVITYTLRRHGDLPTAEIVNAVRAETPWVQAIDAGDRFSGRVIPHRSLVDFFNIESAELQLLREAVNATRVDSPFVPDPPGMRDAADRSTVHCWVDSCSSTGVRRSELFRGACSSRLLAQVGAFGWAVAPIGSSWPAEDDVLAVMGCATRDCLLRMLCFGEPFPHRRLDP